MKEIRNSDGTLVAIIDAATSTEIIEDRGLLRNVAIVTDGFHQFRAQSYAKNAGLTPGAVSASTPLFTLPYYWVREIAAISVQVILGVPPRVRRQLRTELCVRAPEPIRQPQ